MPATRARTITRRLLLSLAALITLLVLGVAIYLVTQRIAGESQLRDTKADLTAAGILKPLAELSPPPSREAVANGEKFLAAIEGISAIAQADPDITGGADLMRFTAPGIAIATSGAPAPIFPPSNKTTPPATWEELRTRLAPAQPILAEARRSLQSPVSYDYDPTSLKSQIPAEHPQKLISWLRASALLHIHDGNLPAAIDDMQAIAHGAAFIGDRPSLISYVLELGIWTYGLNGLSWELLQNPTLTESDLVRLDQIVRTAPTPDGALQALEVELAATPHWIDHLKSAPARDFPWSFSQPGHGLLSTPLADDIRATLWRHVWIDQDEALTLAYWGQDISHAREIVAQENWHAIPESAFTNNASDVRAAWQFPWYNAIRDTNTTRNVLQAAVRFETTRQLILTAIALQRYHLRHARYPETLAALIPDYLPELPNDWYDGQPLKYRPRDTTYLLYSIGPDAIDQGGDPTPTKETANPTMTTGRDIVWPMAPPSET